MARTVPEAVRTAGGTREAARKVWGGTRTALADQTGGVRLPGGEGKLPKKPVVKPKAVTSAAKEPSGYLYHGTRKKSIESIKQKGLESQSRQRNDWEEGDWGPEIQELLYFERKPSGQWGGKESIQLRINEDLLPRGVDVTEDALRPGEFYTSHVKNDAYNIPPEAIEYLDIKTGKWIPLLEDEHALAVKQGKLVPGGKPEAVTPAAGVKVTPQTAASEAGGELLKKPPRNIPYREVRVNLPKQQVLDEFKADLAQLRARLPGENAVNASLTRMEIKEVQNNIRKVMASEGNTVAVRRYQPVATSTPAVETAKGKPTEAVTPAAAAKPYTMDIVQQKRGAPKGETITFPTRVTPAGDYVVGRQPGQYAAEVTYGVYDKQGKLIKGGFDKHSEAVADAVKRSGKPPVEAAEGAKPVALSGPGRPPTEIPATYKGPPAIRPPLTGREGPKLLPEQTGIPTTRRYPGGTPERMERGDVYGFPPESPPPPPDSPLGKVSSMWEPKKKPGRDWGDLYLKVQEYANDIFYGLRRLQTQVAKGQPILAGGSRDLITMLTVSPGASQVGATRYIMAINRIKEIYPQLNPSHLKSYIYLQHAKEVLAEKGPQRALSLGLKGPDLDIALADLKGTIGADWAKFEEAANVVKDVYTAELTASVAEGLVKADVADMLRVKYPWYNPLQYIEDAERLAAEGKNVKPFTVIASGLKRLTKEGTTRIARDPIEVLGEQLIKNEVRRQKNQVARAIITLGQEAGLPIKQVKLARPVAQVGEDVIFRPTKEDIPGTISYFENGTRQVYEVPEWMYREAEVLSKITSDPAPSILGAMRALNNVSKAAFTTFSPAFTVSNVLNDSVTAFIRSGVLPWKTGQRIMAATKGLEKDPIMQAFRLSGGYQQRFFGLTGAQMAKDVGMSGGKVIRQGQPVTKIIMDAIPRAGEAGEQAPRIAKFKIELDRTLPGWRKMDPEQVAKTPQARTAAAKAVEATINFHRGGFLAKSANPYLLFLNASMEGMKLPIRALRESPGARLRLAGLMAGGMGVAVYNMSYPEYFDVPNHIRWGSLMVMLPSKKKDAKGNPKPNYITIIPRFREWSFFMGPETYALEKLFKNNPQDFGEFTKAVVPMVSPISSIPSPEVLKELFEQQANWDFYYNSPIVPPNLIGMPPEGQVTPWTSKTLTSIGERVHVSPIRLQHAVSGILGGAGNTATSVTDYILTLLNPDTTDPGIQQIARQYEQADMAERAKILASLTIQERDAVDTVLKQPEKGIPIIGPIVKRVYPQQGGQLNRTAWVDFEKATEDTRRLMFNSFPEMNRLGITFGQVGTTIQNQTIDTKTRAAYQALSGQVAQRRVRAMIESPYYQQVSDEEKKGLIQDAMQQGRDAAKLALYPVLKGKPVDQAQLDGLARAIENMLTPYWQVESQIWATYSQKVRQAANLISRLPQDEQLKYLEKWPSILRARQEIARRKRDLREANPSMDILLKRL